MAKRAGRPTDRDYELISAMQKAVRRGLELDAGRWFYELAERGHFYWALSRLRVTAFEDIGIADMQSVLFALKAMEMAKESFKTKTGSWLQGSSSAILALCRARKCRVSDHFQAVARGEMHSEPDRPVPDYAYDKHTRKGKAMGRGLDHFREQAARLGPDVVDEPGFDPYEERAYEIWKSGILDAPAAKPSGGLFPAPGDGPKK
jgi:replication-associated recombination protein RarA